MIFNLNALKGFEKSTSRTAKEAFYPGEAVLRVPQTPQKGRANFTLSKTACTLLGISSDVDNYLGVNVNDSTIVIANVTGLTTEGYKFAKGSSSFPAKKLIPTVEKSLNIDCDVNHYDYEVEAVAIDGMPELKAIVVKAQIKVSAAPKVEVAEDIPVVDPVVDGPFEAVTSIEAGEDDVW